MTTSLALQHHTPPPDIVTHLAAMRFDPAGPATEPDIPTVTSIADHLALCLTVDYPTSDRSDR